MIYPVPECSLSVFEGSMSVPEGLMSVPEGSMGVSECPRITLKMTWVSPSVHEGSMSVTVSMNNHDGSTSVLEGPLSFLESS